MDRSAEVLAPTEHDHRTSTFAALRYGQFRLLFVGLAINQIFMPMQDYALGWLVVELAVRDGHPELGPFYLGLIGFSRVVPTLACGLLAGVFADRFDRRLVLLTTRLVSGGVAALLAVVTLADPVSLPAILVLSAVNAGAAAFDFPARYAMMPALVRERDIMSALGLSIALMTAGAIVGPVIGGLLLEPIGVSGLMAVATVSYGAVVLALLAMRPLPPVGRMSQDVLRSFGEGISFSVRQPTVRWALGLSLFAALLARPVVSMLPAIAHEQFHVGPRELSWMLAASGIGSLGGSLLSAAFGNIPRRGIVITVATVLLGSTVLALALLTSVLPALLVLIAMGCFTLVLAVGANGIIQTSTPDRLRGRTIAVYTTLVNAGMPLGQLILGVLATFAGLEATLALAGAATVGLGVLGLAASAPLRAYGSSSLRMGRADP